MTILGIFAMAFFVNAFFVFLGTMADDRREHKKYWRAEEDKKWAKWRIEAKEKGWIS